MQPPAELAPFFYFYRYLRASAFACDYVPVSSWSDRTWTIGRIGLRIGPMARVPKSLVSSSRPGTGKGRENGRLLSAWSQGVFPRWPDSQSMVPMSFFYWAKVALDSEGPPRFKQYTVWLKLLM